MQAFTLVAVRARAQKAWDCIELIQKFAKTAAKHIICNDSTSFFCHTHTLLSRTFLYRYLLFERFDLRSPTRYRPLPYSCGCCCCCC